ncbi:MAG: Fic family protein, partial [Planctomycetes bacterium]|nr:Fic family protein [Planctomycetota bacterium]
MRIPRTPPDAMKVLSGRKPSELGDLLQHPGYSDLARRCETDYWHWDKLRVAGNAKIDLELAWAIIKFGRQQRYRSLNLTGHNGVKLRLTVPDKVQRELMLIDQQLAGRLLSDEESPLTADQRERFIIGALREEAIASSMLEGAATTRQEAKRMLKSGRKARNTGEQMVLNNYRAILFVRENRHQELNPSFLLELQTILTEKTLDDADGVGRFRTEQDSITVVDVRDSEVMHSPPPATVRSMSQTPPPAPRP